MEQQRERLKAQSDSTADASAIDDADAAEDHKKGAAAARRSKESLALEFLQRKERNKLADPETESNVNSAAAVIDSSTLHELDAMQEELQQFKTTFNDLLVLSKPGEAASSRAAPSAQPMSIMQREKTISQREKRLVQLQKCFLVMQDTIERAVSADEQRQNEFDHIKAEVGIVQRAIDTPGTIAKAADIANKRRRAQAMMAKALKLNRKHQGIAEKLPASEAAVKQKHEVLVAQMDALQAEYEQIAKDIRKVEAQHQDVEGALAACERRSAATLLQYGARLPRAAALPDVAMFPIEPLKQELELLYQRQVLAFRTRVAESKLEELNAIWDRLEELKEDERCVARACSLPPPQRAAAHAA
jgi:vacuolar-type H+-ATPase subunit I/STV1